MIENIKSFFKPQLVVIYLYILLSYIAKPPILPEVYVTYSIYLLIAYSIFVIIKNKAVYWNEYLTWSMSIMLLCFISAIYAENIDVAYNGIYTLFIPIALSFSIVQLITSEQDIKNILIMLAISGGILYILMLQYGLFDITERLGNEFSGNSNAFASMILLSLISAICSIYLSKNRLLWLLMIAIIIAEYHMLILSEGRKYLITPLLFLFVLLFKSSGYKFSKLIIILAASIIIIPFLWEVLINFGVIGENLLSRFDMTLAMFEGQTGHMGTGDIERKNMISKGFDYFTNSPIWGNGHCNFSYLFSLENSGGHIGHFSHNNYIELLCNLGIIGFVIYYQFYYKIFKSTYKFHTPSCNIVFTFFIILMILEFGIVSYYTQYMLQILICIASIALFGRKVVK